jgi:hypothetical protein
MSESNVTNVMTVSIAVDVPKDKFDAICRCIERLQREEIKFNGADITIVRGDFTEIDDSSRDLRGAQLLNAINGIISGESDEA